MDLEESKKHCAQLEIQIKALVAEVTRARAETEAVKKASARSEGLAASRVLQELRESSERSQSLAERTIEKSKLSRSCTPS